MGSPTTSQLQMGCDGFKNATFYITNFRDHLIGRSTRLPKYVLENPAVVSLDSNEQTGLPYEDKRNCVSSVVWRYIMDVTHTI